jgi:pimeloyl-ACP methyl ester carboxylesterase
MSQTRTHERKRVIRRSARFVEVDVLRPWHYTERGSGDPLVLLHGNGAVEDFATSGLIELASHRYRVITFDRPGYGYSERPRSRVWTPEAQAALFAAAFRELGIERPIVLGHSWGTQVAVSLGLDWAQSVRSLVLLSGYYYPSVRIDVGAAIPAGYSVLGDLLRYTVSPLVGRLTWPLILRKLFGPNPTPRHMERFPKWMVLRPGQIRASAEETALMFPSAARLSGATALTVRGDPWPGDRDPLWSRLPPVTALCHEELARAAASTRFPGWAT